MLAVIRPAGRPAGLWALPMGNIGPGEDPAATAIREVAEETGAQGKLDRKLGDVRSVYTQSWGEERGSRKATGGLAEREGAGELASGRREQMSSGGVIPRGDPS